MTELYKILIEKNLKSNGILIFTTFNIDSILPKIMKSRYHWIIPMHKFYFSNSTLKFFLEKNNMDLFKITTDTRLISLEYLLEKLCILAPKIDFIFKFFLKFKFLKKMTIKINLLDGRCKVFSQIVKPNGEPAWQTWSTN